ncbi:B3 domain-containing protein Os01g0234100-like isoform X2 [Andrographis paniculata]|uniref:B3 domain-containing protein Os01g0234100-like isoform X2 n=1 Tax=Andrographis paniculata TaxID=175694 RepID=UPI0021E953B2|nr:B3 domain-containing protein Os01g0234100-like isoform X2 [Andrographis paniculata]
MKLKIVHQHQDNRAMKEDLELPPMESLPPAENLRPMEAVPVSSFNPALVVAGKRKRKPKELIDDVSAIVRARKRKSSSSKLRNGTSFGRATFSRSNVGGSSTPAQFKSATMIRAEEVQKSLGDEHPTFLKPLVRSHVGSCFWMGLPVLICKVHLPSKDATVVLENEDGEEFPIKYIAHKTGLSAGWRKFVAGNKLLEGDVLIFQLTKPCRFKVYIIRANDLTEVDGALSLLILDSQTKQNDSGYKAEGIDLRRRSKKRHPKSLPLTDLRMKNHEERQSPSRPEHSGNDSDEVASEVLEGTKFSRASLNLNDVKSFEDFRIIVNGACIDSELPEDIRQKYYDLCCSKNVLLHEHLLPGLYTKLAAGVIAETVNTADLIRSCKLTTPRRDFDVWEKSLRSFELLGLNVGFLQSRLRRLLDLAFESDGSTEIRRYLEAQKEQGRTEIEIQELEAKLGELREMLAKYDCDVESLKRRAESYERRFLEEADAPW